MGKKWVTNWPNSPESGDREKKLKKRKATNAVVKWKRCTSKSYEHGSTLGKQIAGASSRNNCVQRRKGKSVETTQKNSFDEDTQIPGRGKAGLDAGLNDPLKLK